MSFGAIINLVVTLALNVPNAIDIVQEGIKEIEKATDPKPKLEAIATTLEKVLEEVKSVVQSL